MKQLFFISAAFLFILFTNVHSIAQQGVSINARGAAPDSNAILDVSSTTKGALFPRMTTAQRKAIDSPAIGLTVFDLDKTTYCYYTGSEWVEMTTNKDEWSSEDNSNSRANEDWNTQGNIITAGAFIGSTNNQPLIIKSNGTERIRVAGNGNVGIGYTNPLNRTDIHFGVSRTGSHATGRPLYVTGDLGQDANGIEFRDNNATQGIGFGYNTIYAAGTSLNQDLGLKAKGSGGSLKFTTDNVERMRIRGNGNVGIGTSIPNAPLQFANDDRNRKIVMWEYADNNNEFTGFGVNSFILRYQVPWTSANHVFYAGNGPSSSNELMRIQGDGNVGIGTSTPNELLEIGGNGRAFFGDGGGLNRHGLLIDGNEPTYARLESYDYLLDTGRNLVINSIGLGNVGIGTISPHAPLHFRKVFANRKIVLYENNNDEHRYYGLGVNTNAMRYQVPDTVSSHIFYAGTSSSNSDELMRIKGNGNVGIGTSTPNELLEIGGDGRAFFGNGGGLYRHGLLIDGNEPTYARLESYDYLLDTGRNLVINPIGLGNVGIGITTPTEKLHVSGNAKVTGDIMVDGSIVTEAYISSAPDSGFVNFGAGAAPLGFYKDKVGRVYLRGVLTWLDYSLTTIFVLPEGYRPGYDQLFLCYSDIGPTIVRVYSSGAVVKGVTSETIGEFSLDQISFRAEN